MLSKLLAITSCTLLGTAAYALVTIDYATGEGFAGKGDVQLACGFNNAQLQAWGSGAFRVSVSEEVVSERSWICTNSNNQQTQERERTTTSTTSTQGVLSAVARVRNQITGYNLGGYDGEPTTTSSSTTAGPALNFCPANPSTWSLTTPAGDPEILSSTSIGGVQVDCGGGNWVTLAPAL